MEVEEEEDVTEFPCDLCGQSFSRKGVMTLHQSRVHGSNCTPVVLTLIRCPVCKLSISKDRLNWHIARTHGNNVDRKSHKCSLCGKEFRSSWSFTEHQSKAHNNPDAVPNGMVREGQKCDLCGKAFVNKGLMMSHRVRVHGRDPDDSSERKKKNCPICKRDVTAFAKHLRTHTPQEIHKCAECGKEVKSKHALKQHVEMLHKSEKSEFNCDLCHKSFTCLRNLKRHVVISHVVDKEFFCIICRKPFLTEVELNSHLKNCNGLKYKCDLCSSTFKGKSPWVNHLKTAHSRKDKCSLCVKSFSSAEEYQSHLESEGNIKCSEGLCSETFRNRCFALQHWTKVHLKTLISMFSELSDCDTPGDECAPRELKCEDCGEIFKSRYLLNSHIVVVHQSLLEYTCELCSQKFSQQYLLNRHKRTEHPSELPFRCKTCSKGFSSHKRLKVHIKSHTVDEDKPFKCARCPKSFLFKFNLDCHMVSIHGEGEKPFKCTVCTAAFFTTTHLKRHLSKHELDGELGVGEGFLLVPGEIIVKTEEESNETMSGHHVSNGEDSN